jgi:hypothetical protein
MLVIVLLRPDGERQAEAAHAFEAFDERATNAHDR